MSSCCSLEDYLATARIPRSQVGLFHFECSPEIKVASKINTKTSYVDRRRV